MLPDPVSLAAHSPTAALTFRVIGGVPKGAQYGNERRDDTGAYGIVTTHDKAKGGDRHYVRVTHTKDATNPYTGTTQKMNAVVSLSIQIPPFGWTAAEAAALVAVLTDYISDAEVTVPNLLLFQS